MSKSRVKAPRLLPLLLAGALTASLLSPAALAAQEGQAVTIRTVRDFLDFAQSCTLDTWSRNKTVTLAADLDLSGAAFTPVPTFGGVFDGGGHTVSGLSLTGPGSNQGLFRYVQEGAVVKNLNVRGRVAPSGSAANVGGVAGTNWGTLLACSFSGEVRGRANVGGVAGVNRAAGRLADCSASGSVTGETCAGGVAGHNAGTLLRCANAAGVNTSMAEAAATLDGLDNLDPSAPLEQLTEPDARNDADAALAGRQDMGGVAGYSSGVIQSCVNTGDVGYPHVGYNVGGVAGRQTGYLSGCSNAGHIQGRKDVGGIAGQAEPYVTLGPGGDTLEKLRAALDRLSRLIDSAAAHADGSGAEISARLTELGDRTDMARADSRDLLDRTRDLLNANADAVNDLSVSLTNALDKISPALGDLAGASDDFSTLAEKLEPALDSLALAESAGAGAMAQLRAAMGDLQAASQDARAAAEKLRDALRALQDAVVGLDPAAGAAALSQLAEGLAEAGAALDRASRALERITALSPGDPDFTAALGALTRAVGDLGDAGAKAGAGLRAAAENLDAEKLAEALKTLSAAMEDLSAASGELESAFARLRSAAGSGESLSNRLGEAFRELRPVANAGESAARKLSTAFDRMQAAVDELRKNGAVTFTPIDEDYRAAGDRLYDSLAALSGGMTDLNDAVSAASRTLTGDLRAVNDQFSVVMRLVLDAVEDLQNGPDQGLDDRIQDVSDRDAAATTLGKIADCRNTGAVEGDRNVGGVAGSMAIEYDLDPEDDSSLDLSLSATYETRAVAVNCVNRGAITGKKDCVGGIAGRMDLGLVSACQNYGGVRSTGGDYVGGVAGLSVSTIERSYAKCVLSGDSYVGGVAGSARRMRDCAAIASVEDGSEYLGALAGDGEITAGLARNYFLDQGLGAVDGVSYDGHAQPASFEALRQLPGIPAELVSFTLTLVTMTGEEEVGEDGGTVDRVVASIPFLYGADLSLVELPPVPEREGCFGRWPDFDPEGVHSDLTLKAVYAPYVTVLASGAAPEGGPSLALAEGRFTDEAVLTAVPVSLPAPEGAEAPVWELRLTGADLSETDVIPLRLLCPGGGQVWQYGDGGWTRLDAGRSGSYLTVELRGTSGVFCAVPKASPAAAAAAPALILAAAGVAAALARSRRKKKRASSAAAADSGNPPPVKQEQKKERAEK